MIKNRKNGNGNGTDRKPQFGTILADPAWQFMNRTGKMAPEHRRLHRYKTMKLEEICTMQVSEIAAAQSHLYLWVPNALLAEGLRVMSAWGFTYKSNIVWYKVRKDGGPDGRGVGFYFRNVTELLLWDSGETAHAGTRTARSEHCGDAEARALTQAPSGL